MTTQRRCSTAAQARSPTQQRLQLQLQMLRTQPQRLTSPQSTTQLELPQQPQRLPTTIITTTGTCHKPPTARSPMAGR
jgi:hypothetical protein